MENIFIFRGYSRKKIIRFRILKDYNGKFCK